MSLPPEQVFIALGSNLGDRQAQLAYARTALESLPGTRVVAVTEIEETAPVGPVEQPAFLNQMLLLATRLGPHALLEACLAIERAAGRVRGERWGPRTLDIDIVRFGDRVVNDPILTLPHPELPNRDWWQRELAALSP